MVSDNCLQYYVSLSLLHVDGATKEDLPLFRIVEGANPIQPSDLSGYRLPKVVPPPGQTSIPPPPLPPDKSLLQTSQGTSPLIPLEKGGGGGGGRDQRYPFFVPLPGQSSTPLPKTIIKGLYYLTDWTPLDTLLYSPRAIVLFFS